LPALAAKEREMEEVRKVHVTTVGKLLGVSGCEAEGFDHEWVIEWRDGGEAWVCARCGDEEWIYTDAERRSLAKRFPWMNR